MASLLNTMPKLVIGLTGGIGSGKTAVSDWFAAKGIDVVDADVIAREVVAPHSPTLQKITQAFGGWVLTEQGELNRAALREYIFSTPSARERLEAVTHPAIRESIIQALAKSCSAFTMLVAPLLLEGGESGLQSLCHRVLVVDIPVALQKQRAAARDKQSLSQIEKIMAAQFSRQERLSQADDMIDNSGDLADLYKQLLPLYQYYLHISAG